MPLLPDKAAFNTTPDVHSYTVSPSAAPGAADEGNEGIRLRRRLLRAPRAGGAWSQTRFEDGPRVPCVRVGATLVTCAWPGRRGGGDDAVVLYAHGNGWDLGGLVRPFRPRPYDPDSPQGLLGGDASLLQHLADCCGRQVVAFEYPGYGAGDPRDVSVDGAVRAMLAVHEWLAPRRVVFYGFSVGAAIAAEAARRLLLNKRDEPRLAGLFLQGSFASLLRTAPRGRARAFAMRALRAAGVDALVTSRFVGGLPLPVAYAHGTEDAVCPIERARKMAERGGNTSATLWAPGADHNDLPAHPAFAAFVRDAVGGMMR
jgi:acetyl esterase/lipase